MRGSLLVFVARVLDEGEERYGGRPARVRILERLRNVPDGLTEVDVDNSPGSSCFVPLYEGVDYVLSANPSRERSNLLHISTCAGNFKVQGKRYLLDALRNMAAGGPSRIVGTVHNSTTLDYGPVVSGARVVATSGKARYETVSDAGGRYQLFNVTPGRYQIQVSKPGFIEDAKFNQRFDAYSVDPRELTYLPAHRREEGGVVVMPNACSLWNVKLDSDALLTGSVRDPSGSPAPGVVVEVFLADFRTAVARFFDRLKFGPDKYDIPIIKATTDAAGRYTIRKLSEGDYDLSLDPTPLGAGANGFAKTAPPSRRRIHLEEGAQREGVDLVMEKPRSGWTLW